MSFLRLELRAGHFSVRKIKNDPRESHPREVGGWFQIQPACEPAPSFLNPTNGSWWIVQARPPNKGAERVQSEFSLMALLCGRRLDLNNPP